MVPQDTYSGSINDLLRVTRGQLQGTFRSYQVYLQIALLQMNTHQKSTAAMATIKLVQK